jgi:AraC-like DNA-binding protein
MCLGQVLLFIALVGWQQVRSKVLNVEAALLTLLLCCVACSVVLTMNYRPPLLLELRPYLLVLVDALPFSLWAWGILVLSDVQRPFSHEVSTLIKLAWSAILLLYFSWHSYFFIALEGNGWFHNVSHWFAIIAVLHLVYVCLQQWQDDLVDARRRLRAVLLMISSLILTVYVMSEISGTLFMRSETGSIIGAIILLSLSTVLGIIWLKQPSLPSQHMLSEVEQDSSITDNQIEVPAQYLELFQQLNKFKSQGGFTEANLTLTRLAEHLNSQEHRLRALINQVLGYRNFSHYLNDYRLPLASQQLLSDSNKPITEIAFEVGYGSITSFNRAFKSAFGQSPSDYRQLTKR